MGRERTEEAKPKRDEQPHPFALFCAALGPVVSHFDGYLAPLACVSVSDYKRCSKEPVCRFRRVMLQSRNMDARLMDNATLAEVMQVKPVSDAEVAAIQVVHGEGI